MEYFLELSIPAQVACFVCGAALACSIIWFIAEKI